MNEATAIAWRVRRKDLALCWSAAAVTLFVFFNAGSTPDSDRFLSQADAIFSGEGFLTYGRLETWLPPGYPVFLAALIRLSASA